MAVQKANASHVDVVEIEPIMARFSLRARPAEVPALASALGLALPARIGDVVRSEGRLAACLGPDEWVVVVPQNERDRIVADLAAVYADAPHSLTDISDREVSFQLNGPQAKTLLSIGCARDLDALEAGRAVRTVFDGVQAVLWREDADMFHLDVWRSFAPHVRALLVTGRAELAAGH